MGYSATSGLKLITADGDAFKDLNRNGKPDAYEDWRLTPEERTADLASQLSINEIAGLMLYSNHQSIPGTDQGFRDATYNGKKFKESGAQPDALSDAQQIFLRDDKVRHILITKVQSPEIAARRLLLNIFRTGLFENPYLNPAESQAIVGSSDFMRAGYDAQVKSVVMLKNKARVLPLAKTKKVYIPKRHIPAVTDFSGEPTEARTH